ncbi:heavy-metal-associated domain-containing protein [Ferruginibacter sp.]|uniref:heavy-metal-associated domain-containing protein n=1 Tax=Ferruginibacter sp. TaxID=1940288 RepID=UPI00265A3F82|nr:heavy-metal-associated domain-containing protein [Ferruginibacter sp.]
MKKISLSLLAVIGFVTLSFAQQKAVEKVVIKTPTVQCEQCKERIESYLKREPGISAVKVDFKKKTTTITYLTDRNNIEQLKTAIANAGYDADDVSADGDAYKKLPKCCKNPAGAINTKTSVPQ